MPDRGNFYAERVVYSESFDIKVADKSTRRGLVEYKVLVGYHAHESGNANWPDDRACHFDPIERKLIRNITLTSANGDVRNIGTSTTVLPAPSSEYWKHPCDKYLGEDHYDMPNLLNESLGTKAAWDQQIAVDKQQVETILDLVGTITDRKIDAY